MLKSADDNLIRRELARPGVSVLKRYAPLGNDVPDIRTLLHASSVGRITLFSVSAEKVPPRGYNSDFQVALPLVGLFGWKVGHAASIIDANTALFSAPDQEYEECHPIEGLGHASLLIDPCPHIVQELRALCSSGSGDPFTAITRPVTPRGQALAHQLARSTSARMDAMDELIVATLLEFARIEQAPSRAPRAVVAKAKRYIHELGGQRLSLDDAAATIGVSPIYLTQAFKASEGVPLYRYHLNLRLSQALGQLPHCESITHLALELGFSSHSHFSAAFIARFNMSPSEYRELARRGEQASAAWLR